MEVASLVELMRLEMRKFRIGPYIRAALIANVMILAFLCLISFFGEVKEKMPLTDYGMAFAIIDTLTRATYIVFAAVLLSRIVIDEFRTKSIALLFMYPINRKSSLQPSCLSWWCSRCVRILRGICSSGSASMY